MQRIRLAVCHSSLLSNFRNNLHFFTTDWETLQIFVLQCYTWIFKWLNTEEHCGSRERIIPQKTIQRMVDMGQKNNFSFVAFFRLLYSFKISAVFFFSLCCDHVVWIEFTYLIFILNIHLSTIQKFINIFFFMEC